MIEVLSECVIYQYILFKESGLTEVEILQKQVNKL